MSERAPLKKLASNKILLIASYWSGDKTQMSALLKLLADLEPTLCPLADLLLINRFDCEPFGPEVLKYLARKFHIFTYQSVKKGVGWPCGCNSLFFSAMEWFYSMSAEKIGIPRYKAAFMLESDCAPLNKDWLRIFSANWDKVKGRAFIAGCKVSSEHIHEHINGNCFVSGSLRFLRWLATRVQESNVGWDYCLAADFRQWGVAELPGMAFRWNTPSMSDAELDRLRNFGTIWLHGCKSFDAINYARRVLL